MSFINTIPETEATGLIKELYDTAAENSGFVPNYLRLFSHRPEVYQAWQGLIASIARNLTFRRYELVTVAAARALQSTYCMMAHGNNLVKRGEADTEQLAAIASDYHEADLSEEEVAIMEFAEKIILNSGAITQTDVDRLKGFGLTDAEIFDITVTATVRSFFSKTLDALNAEPDANLVAYDAELNHALTVGRSYSAPLAQESAVEPASSGKS